MMQAQSKRWDTQKIGLVNIGSGCFIGANLTVLPGVTIGKGSIVGANSLVSKDIPEGSVYAGNPAKFICSAEDYFDNMEKMMKTAPIFDDSYTILNITQEKKEKMIEALRYNRIGFIV